MSVCTKSTDGKHQWVKVGDCSHAIEQNSQPSYRGEALECSACGRVAHRWVHPAFACFRRRLGAEERARLIADEHARCPIWERWQAQAQAQAQAAVVAAAPGATP